MIKQPLLHMQYENVYREKAEVRLVTFEIILQQV